MVVFVGQVGGDMADREAFQEVDYRRMYGPLTKWVAQIERTERIPEYVSQAFHRAASGRPGPVLLALPEDMLFAEAAVADAPRYRAARAAPSSADLAKLEQMLAGAECPFVILGGGGWSAKAIDGLRAWAEANALPVGTSFRCQDYLDNRHGCFAGDVGIGINPKLAQQVREADVLLVIGARLGEMTTGGYTLLDVPVPRQKLIHVHAGVDELGRVYHATLPINSNYEEFVLALSSLKLKGERWREQTRSAHASYLEWSKPQPMPGALHYGEVIAWLSEHLPEDAIVANGAGNFAGWVTRHFRYRGWQGSRRTQLGPTSGSMGYGVPAALAAKIAEPGRTVVAVAGDGDFLMNGQELATARQYGAAIVVLVVNNGMYGTIRIVRHDPHAPGARIPRARLGHRPAESGFRRVRARLRLPRRDGRAHRRFRARLRALGGLGQALADRAAHRPGGDHAGNDARRAQGRGAQEARLITA